MEPATVITSGNASGYWTNLTMIIQTNTTAHAHGDVISADRQMPDVTYIYAIASVLYAVVFLFGVLGNILVITVICRIPEMSTATNFFLVNLSVADLLVVIVCMPSAFVEFAAKEKWLLGREMCKLVPYLEISVTNASSLTMLAICFERYYAICRPLEVLYTCTKRRAGKILAVVWFLSLSVSTPLLFMAYTESVPHTDGTIVQVCRTPVDEAWKEIYIWGIFIMFFVIPCLMMSVIYPTICRQLMNHNVVTEKQHPKPSAKGTSYADRKKNNYVNNHHAQHLPLVVARDLSSATSRSTVTTPIRRSGGGTRPGGAGSKHYAKPRAMALRQQVVNMLITIFVFSFVCFLPWRVFGLWNIYSSEEQKENMGEAGYLSIMCLSRILFYMNSAGNPVLYNMVSCKFREACRKCVLHMCKKERSVILETSTHSTHY